MRYDATSASGNRGDLLEELRMLDDTLAEAASVEDLRYFSKKRAQTLDDYLDSLYSNYEPLSLPERELRLLGELADNSEKQRQRLVWYERREARQAKPTFFSKYSSKLMKAAVVAALMLGSMAPRPYDAEVKAGIAIEKKREAVEEMKLITKNAVTMPAISVPAPTQEQVDSTLSHGFWNIYPVAGEPMRANSFFGRRVLADSVEGNRYHEGIDLYAPAGSAIIAPASGVVTVRGKTSLHIDAGSYSYKTVHMWPRKGMREGDMVEAGDTIGFIAAKKYLPRGVNPHLHIEVLGEDGVFTSASGKNIDPLMMFNDSIGREIVRNAYSHAPSGIRYMKGATIEEKLKNKEREQVTALAYTQLAPIYVIAKRTSRS